MSAPQFCKPTQDEAQVSEYFTETFFEDFADFQNQAEADAIWAPATPARSEVDFELSKLRFDWDTINSNGTTQIDRGKQNIPLGKQWKIRFKIRFDILVNAGNNVNFFGIFAVDQNTSSAAGNPFDGLAIAFVNAGNTGYDLRISDGQNWANDLTIIKETEYSVTFVVDTDYFVEIERDGDKFYAQVFLDKDFTNPFGAKLSGVVPETVVGLQFFGPRSVFLTTVGTMNGNIEFIQLWNFNQDKFEIPDFEDSFGYSTLFDANLQWSANSPVDNDIDIDKAQLFWNMLRDGTDTRIVHDLDKEGIVVSDVNWTLRYHLHVNAGGVLTTSSGANLQVLLQDTDVGQTATNDTIGFSFVNTLLPFGRQWNLLGRESGGSSGFDASPNNFVPAGEQDWFIELRRLSATLVRARVYRDPEFTDLFEELNIVTSVANVGHRFLVVSSGDQVTAWNGTETGFIDEIKFWNRFVADPDLQQPDFTDEFAGYITQGDADEVWPPAGTGIDVNVATDELDWDFVRTSLHKATAIDLKELGITVEEAQWTLRWKQTVNNFTQIPSSATAGWFGLYDSDETVASPTNQAFIHFFLRNDLVANLQEIRTMQSDGSTNPNTGVFDAELSTSFLVGTPMFFELIRESLTSYRLNLYSDAEFTVLLDTTGSITITSPITGLRYLKCLGFSGVSAVAQTFDGIIDDVQFWNGTGRTNPAGDYQANFARDLWKTSNATFFSIDKTNERLLFNNGGGSEDIAFDLLGRGIIPATLAENDRWRLRFKMQTTNVTTTTTNRILIGVTSLDETVNIASGVEDGLLIEFRQVTGTIQILIGTKNNAGQANNGGTFWSGLSNGLVLFAQIERISTTEVVIGLYSDKDYRNPIALATTSTPLPSGIENLRYIKMGSTTPNNGDIDGFISEVSFNVFPPSTPRAKYSRLRDRPADNDVTLVQSAHTPIDPLSEVTATLKFDQKNFYWTDFTEYILQADADNDFPTTDTAVVRAVVSPTLAIDVNIGASAVEDSLVHDFGQTLSGEKWTVRFKFDLLAFLANSSTGIGIDMGITSVAGLRNVIQDSIGLEMTIDQDAGDQFFRGISANNAFMGNLAGTKFTQLPAVQTFFVEIKRINPTEYEVSLYSDVRYRNLIESKIETISGGSANEALRFLKIAVFKSGGTNTLDVEIDDIQVWDGETDVDYQEGRLSRHLLASGAQDNLIFEDTVQNHVHAEPTRNITNVHSASINLQDINGVTPPVDIDNANWTMRFKLEITDVIPGTIANDNQLTIGISNASARIDGNSVQDFLGFAMRINSVNQLFDIVAADNTNIQTGLNLNPLVTPVTVGTFFVEMTRFDTTNFILSLYRDAEYTELIETQIKRDVPAGIVGLEFFAIKNLSGPAVGSATDGLAKVNVSEIRIFDGLPNRIATGLLTDKLGLFTNRGGLV